MNGGGTPRAPGEGGRSKIARIPIGEEADVAVARLLTYRVALAMGFREGSAAAVATAVSEVARNIVVHAGRGEIRIARLEWGARYGLEIVARDEAPGIADVERAMSDGYSTGRGMGSGLPGAKRLVDEFDIVSAVGEGTTVTMKKWLG